MRDRIAPVRQSARFYRCYRLLTQAQSAALLARGERHDVNLRGLRRPRSGDLKAKAIEARSVAMA